MFFIKTRDFAGFVVAIGGSFWASGPAVSGQSSQTEGYSQFLPVQSISYEFGSKAMRGYFVQEGEVCLVTLMIIEKIDPDRLSPVTAARVRLMLDPDRSRASIARRAVRSTLPAVRARRQSLSTMARGPSLWRDKALRRGRR